MHISLEIKKKLILLYFYSILICVLRLIALHLFSFT